MKAKLILTFVFFLGIFILPTQAMVEPHSSNSEIYLNSTQLKKSKQPRFLNKIIIKIAEKRFKEYNATATLNNTEKSKGDKLAAYGLWTVLGSLFLFLLLGIPALSSLILLRYLALLVNLSGLIASIIALTRDDLSKRGKKMAWWGVGTVAVELFLTLLLLILVIIALGNL